MIKLENTEVMGWEAAIRGMRNPMNSWEQSDSSFEDVFEDQENLHTYYMKNAEIGPNDFDLMKRLRNAGTDHRKFMRMIIVYVDITAPLYWWKEFKTYRTGRRFGDNEPGIIDDGYLEYDIEMNSCSTMHKIADKEFTLDDFSCEHLFGAEDMIPPYQRDENSINEDIALSAVNVDGNDCYFSPKGFMQITCDILNRYRNRFLETKDKKYWWQMIQLLPSSYNQKRTVMLNYEVLANMYKSRKNHKLDEWRNFCMWIRTLPYSQLITGEFDEKRM